MRTVTAQITLKKGREQSLLRFHPWVFSGAIQQVEGQPNEGDWVEVKDAGRQTLAFGHYQNGSIAVRVLHFGTLIPPHLYRQKLSRAFELRSLVRSNTTNCFRLVHGEGDGLPGLIIDIYAGVAVVQAHSVGVHTDRAAVAEALQEVMADELAAMYYKPVISGMQAEYLMGMAAVPHSVREHGNAFLVDWEEGQKTGFFLDQRENRMRLAAYATNRLVLNTFCYTGGFSVYALQAGARLVHSVDASARAVDLARRNLEVNGFSIDPHEVFVADTFEFLKAGKTVYDLIILDPPAFAKHKDARHQAMKGYQRLNAEAMRCIAPGGILFTFSCSQVVDRQLFYDTVVSAAIQSGRQISVLEQLSQPADHPVSIYHAEGEYLKGLVLHVQ